MYWEYLKEHSPIHLNDLILNSQPWTYLAEQMAWVRDLNSIRNRAEKFILRELIFREDVA